MKSIFTAALLAASLMPMAAQARVSPGELARDRQDIREEREELRHARRYGDRGDIREERGELRDARREYREDLQDRNRNRGYHGQYRHYDRRGHNGYVRYALPRAQGSNYWVRDHRDALLVNRHNGRVVRVIRGYYG
jgi:Ni/Co efflux regulator RcnB